MEEDREWRRELGSLMKLHLPVYWLVQMLNTESSSPPTQIKKARQT